MPEQPDFEQASRRCHGKNMLSWILAIFCSDLTIAWGAQYIFSEEDLQK
jgi:hypothetical protein